MNGSIRKSIWKCGTLICVVLLLFNTTLADNLYFSPTALAADKSGEILFIAGATMNEVVAFNIKNSKISQRWKTHGAPTGLALEPDESKLFVTCSGPDGGIQVLDLKKKTIISKLSTGHTPMSPIVSPDGHFLYECNRFNNDVWIHDLLSQKLVAKIPVLREPIAMAMTSDGRQLFVANHLPAGPADAKHVAAAVSVIDIAGKKRVSHIKLPDGSTGLRGICISPDNQYIFVTHILAHFRLPTTQLERGWMNSNALSIISVKEKKLYSTLLLDDVDRGAANPWAITCSPDGKYLCVTHAGTHELSIIDLPQLMQKITDVRNDSNFFKVNSERLMGSDAVEISQDLTFLVGIRSRVSLQGNGPRALIVVGDQVVIAEYFSDSLAKVALTINEQKHAQEMVLGTRKELDIVRRGEMFFNDASLCFQNWQSCASCHPDGRADGLNWDLLNDGIGNPKNTKSLLLSHVTPPVMITGIRDRAETAVRAGIRFIQFSVKPEEDARAIDAYLRVMKPVPSPNLVDGHLNEAAQRGKEIFKHASCNQCHSGAHFTDLKKYQVGTGIGNEKNRSFDSPMLKEIWRTGPYLYDGRAADMRQVLIQCNPEDKHGVTAHLNDNQIDDLIMYILSL